MDDKIKVTDKRMFDSSGELREEYRQGEVSGEAAKATAEPAPEERSRSAAEAQPEPEPKATAAESAAATRPVEDEPARQAGRGPLREPGFVDLIDLLAQPIVMFLGDAPLPDGSSAKDLGLARYHIDLLELVANRTKGNLAPGEEKLLADLLYEFRLRYVEKAG